MKNFVEREATYSKKRTVTLLYFITYLIVDLHMQHNKDYAINLYACVARSASCEWLIISLCKYRKRSILSGKAIKQTTEFHEFLREWERPLFQAWARAR